MKYKPTICFKQFKDQTPVSDGPETITAYYVGDGADKAFGMVLSEQPDSTRALAMIEDKLGLKPNSYDLAPLPVKNQN